MRIIRNQLIVDDHWQHVPDGSESPEGVTLPEGDIIVSLARWQTQRERLLARVSRLGIRLKGTDRVETIAEELAYFSTIALEFTIFTDGRGYSQARSLRQRYGYRGEIRAVGDFLRDQLFFMHRCGINAFEMRADRDLEDALKAFTEFSVTYQPAADPSDLVFHRRAWQQRH